MAGMHPIEKELRTKLKIKVDRDKDRDREALLLRIHNGLEALPDEEWESMAHDTQLWANDAARAVKKGKPIPDFPVANGADPDPVPTKAAKAEKPDKADKPEKAPSKAPAATKAKADRAPAVKEAAPAPRKRAAGADGMSMMTFLRHYLVSNMDATVEEIRKALEKSPHKVPSDVTITTVRSDFRAVIRILRERGYFKDGLDTGTFV